MMYTPPPPTLAPPLHGSCSGNEVKDVGDG